MMTSYKNNQEENREAFAKEKNKEVAHAQIDKNKAAVERKKEQKHAKRYEREEERKDERK